MSAINSLSGACREPFGSNLAPKPVERRHKQLGCHTPHHAQLKCQRRQQLPSPKRRLLRARRPLPVARVSKIRGEGLAQAVGQDANHVLALAVVGGQLELGEAAEDVVGVFLGLFVADLLGDAGGEEAVGAAFADLVDVEEDRGEGRGRGADPVDWGDY